MSINRLLEEVGNELVLANNRCPPFSSSHEGYAVIQGELDELWDDIRSNTSPLYQRKEAIRVAAMAIKYVQFLDAKMEKI